MFSISWYRDAFETVGRPGEGDKLGPERGKRKSGIFDAVRINVLVRCILFSLYLRELPARAGRVVGSRRNTVTARAAFCELMNTFRKKSGQKRLIIEETSVPVVNRYVPRGGQQREKVQELSSNIFGRVSVHVAAAGTRIAKGRDTPTDTEITARKLGHVYRARRTLRKLGAHTLLHNFIMVTRVSPPA